MEYLSLDDLSLIVRTDAQTIQVDRLDVYIEMPNDLARAWNIYHGRTFINNMSTISMVSHCYS